MADIEAINDLKDDEKLSAIEERAAMLASELNSAKDPSQIKSLGDAAKMLLAMIPGGSPRTGTVTGRVADVIGEAAKKEAEADGDESSVSYAAGGGSRSRMSQELQKAIYNQFMSPEERAYFDKFQAGTQYRMASIDENGNITEKLNEDGKQATVDGAQLKEDFARVKSYTLTEEQQATLTTPDSQRMDAMTPAAEKEELDKLEKSLNNLEGQKAQELAEAGASPEEAKRVRGSFMKARERVRDLKDGLDDLEKAKKGGRRSAEEYAMGDIKLKRGRLRDTLQGDVIDDTLTGKKRSGSMGREKDDDLANEMVTPARTRAGGVSTAGDASAQEANTIIAATQDEGTPADRQQALVSGMRDVSEASNLSPAAAGQVLQTARER
jgi:hypothetical protein